MTFTTTNPQIQPQPSGEIEYPDHDGNPMSDNTEQFRWIVIIKENLEMMYADRSDVFVAGDLLWYPIEGDNKTRLAPDAMVAIGRPKGRRGSYMQWQEDNIAPQVAFEILSPRNYQPEMERKRQFYETYGVEEYYSYDPDRDRLKGWIRQGSELLPISDMEGWVSPLLEIRFTFVNKELKIYRPNGQKFLTSVELEDLAKQEREEKLEAQKRTRKALRETRLAQQETALIQQEMALAQQALLQEQQRSQSQRDQIVINLLRSGMASQQIADIAGCSIDQVEALRV